MPRVVVDLFKLRTPYCGLGQVCTHLGRALGNRPGDEFELNYFLRTKDRGAIGADEASCVAAHDLRKEKVLRWVRPAFLPLVSREPIDLWHATDQFYKHLPLDPRTPVLLTIHDLNFLREKHKGTVDRYRNRLQRAVDRAAAVTTISEFVAGEIREHLDLRGKPLKVVYNGVHHDDTPGERPAFLPDGPFLFTIGTVFPKKNFHVLIPLAERFPQYRIVIAGMDQHDYAQEIRDELRTRGLTDRVLLPGTIDNEHRQWLYANCSAFLFPSLTEGFGLPVIEAMHHGKPVFCSRLTSLPEVAGPEAFYWDSFAPDAMAAVFEAGMRQADSDPAFAARLEQRAARFTWESSAEAYLSIYRELTLGAATQSRQRAA